jgi:YVTN family beta-propeller protein
MSRARRRGLVRLALLLCAVVAAAIWALSSNNPGSDDEPKTVAAAPPPSPAKQSAAQRRRAARRYTVPPLLNPRDVYAADRPGRLSPVVRHLPSRVYVPNSESNSVSVINPRTYEVIDQFPVGINPQHVVPAYDLKTLWVNNDEGNSLTPINPATGRPGRPIAVTDPYNLYFTPDGRYAIVVEERLQTLDFRDPHTMRSYHRLPVPCDGVNHMDFTADGRYALVTCEFGGGMIEVDIPRQRVVGRLTLRSGAEPQDVKLSPDGKTFYIADQASGGVWLVDAKSLKRVGFIPTGAGAHGEYVSRNSRYLYVSDRSAGAVSVISFAARKVVHTWQIPGGSPDMGGVSADGRVLWLSGRYGGEVYAISTRNGHLLARIPVGSGPHGLCVYPQPGRYSLGHTGVFR